LRAASRHSASRSCRPGAPRRALADAGLAVTEIGDYTGFPEMLDGRVKTLHPKVHAGILARRDVPAHAAALAKNGIPPIDLVVVNLYPFRETVAKSDCPLDGSDREHRHRRSHAVARRGEELGSCGVVVEPGGLRPGAGGARRERQGAFGSRRAFALARKAFSHTASYDGAVSNWLTARGPDGAATAFPDRFNLQAVKVQDLRYGENPHQQAAFYRDENPAPGNDRYYRQLKGKELSFNNLADADAAWECVKSLASPPTRHA
jgi:phosphoribosylaminoimidazolecarboxamide formyltransferase/IMP cyclohydrolase